MLQDLKHYLNAIKAKQSALNAQKPMVGVGNPTSALSPSGSSFDPSSLALIGIHRLLLSNLTTGRVCQSTWALGLRHCDCVA